MPESAPRAKWWTPWDSRLCAHCSLSVLASLAAIVLGGAGWLGGASVLAWVVPPVLILLAFVWFVRSPRECPV